MSKWNVGNAFFTRLVVASCRKADASKWVGKQPSAIRPFRRQHRGEERSRSWGSQSGPRPRQADSCALGTEAQGGRGRSPSPWAPTLSSMLQGWVPVKRRAGARD